MTEDDRAIIDHPPPEGWQVIDTIGIMRCYDTDGVIKLWVSNRSTRDVASVLGDIEYVRETLLDMVRKPIVVLPFGGPDE
jgi:hypothetical protein